MHCLRIFAWNINGGLQAKMGNKQLQYTFVEEDIIILCETKLTKENKLESKWLQRNWICYRKNRNSKDGKASGGDHDSCEKVHIRKCHEGEDPIGQLYSFGDELVCTEQKNCDWWLVHDTGRHIK